MLCDRILCNIASADPARFAGKVRDEVHLTWRDCTRRALRLVSGAGVRVGVLLPRGIFLRHGDVLFDGESTYTVAVVAACEVWVASFEDPGAQARAAVELGNLHVPVEVGDGMQLVTLPDGPVRAVLDAHAASWWPDVRRFRPLRATVVETPVRLSPDFQLTKSRE